MGTSARTEKRLPISEWTSWAILADLASNSIENESAIEASEQGGAVQQELVEAENAESEQDRAWREYLTASVSPAPAVEVSYVESPIA